MHSVPELHAKFSTKMYNCNWACVVFTIFHYFFTFKIFTVKLSFVLAVFHLGDIPPKVSDKIDM